MNQHLRVFLQLSAVLAILAIPSCNHGSREAEDENSGVPADAIREVVITRAQFEKAGMKTGVPSPVTFSQIIGARGYIMASPSGMAHISTLIPGKVNQINYSVGEHIRKGQLLFTIESSQIILLQQEYASAFNELRSLKANYERQTTLSREKITSNKEFVNTESDYLSMLSKVEGLKAQLKLINIDPSGAENGAIVSDASVYSPIKGYITKQDLVLGQYIEPRETVAEIIDTDQLQLHLNLFENDLKDLSAGQAVIFYDPDDPDVLFEARLTHIGKSIDPDTKTVLCIAELSPEDRSSFVNNLFVEASIITCYRDALAIPDQALIEEDGRYYVLILAEENPDSLVFHSKAIEVGVIQQDYAEVFDKGLEGILLEGVYNLQVATGTNE